VPFADFYFPAKVVGEDFPGKFASGGIDSPAGEPSEEFIGQSSGEKEKPRYH